MECCLDVDRVVVLSLNRRMDRRLRFLDGLPRPWPLAHPQIIDAIDGMLQPRPPEWTSSAGAYGCLLSHLRILDSAIHDGVECLLVLEDDALFVKDFAVRLARFARRIPDDWGLLMLGGQHCKAPLYEGIGVVRCVDTYRTHAYIVRQTAMGVLRSVWSQSMVQLDHDLGQIQQVVPTYAPHPFLVGQAAGRSDLSDRMEPARFW